MFRSAYKIDFADWIDLQENTEGFYDPKQEKRIQFYDELCPEGKQLAKKKYLEEKEEYVLSLQKKNISKGNKRVLQKYVKSTGDFSQVDEYKEIDFSGVGFQQAFIESKTLEEVNFSRAALNWASFENSTIKECSFKEAQLKGAIFKGVMFRGSNNFSGSDLSIADFQYCDLKGCSFFDTNIKEVNFTETDLRGVDLSKTKGKGAFFKDAKVDDLTIPPVYISKICKGLKYFERVVNADNPKPKDLVNTFNNLEKYMEREEYMLFYGERIERLFLAALEKSKYRKFKYNFKKNLKSLYRKVLRK